MGKRKAGASSLSLPGTITQQPAQLRSPAGPYAVYFPSGFDPATGVKWETYTHSKRRHSQIVGRAGNVDFVGTSMGGEHSAAPPCRYALGVFDPASGSLSLSPLAHDGLLRLEPRVRGVDYGPSAEPPAPEPAGEDRKAAAFRLVSQLGSQRRQRQLLAREAARVDPGNTVSTGPALRAQVERGPASPSKEDLVAAAIAGRALPPHDPAATSAAAAYPARGLVWDALWDALPVADFLAAADGADGGVPALRASGGLLTDYVGGRLADRASWTATPPVGRGERARLLALLDVLVPLATRHGTLRGGGGAGGGEAAAAAAQRTGIPAATLGPLLARFYTHHAADAEGGPGERWVQAPAQKDLLLSWCVAAALRAEPAAVLDAGEVEALAAALQLRPAALAERCRELGAVVSSAGTGKARRSRVALLPPAAESRTLASYFPALKGGKKGGRG